MTVAAPSSSPRWPASRLGLMSGGADRRPARATRARARLSVAIRAACCSIALGLVALAARHRRRDHPRQLRLPVPRLPPAALHEPLGARRHSPRLCALGGPVIVVRSSPPSTERDLALSPASSDESARRTAVRGSTGTIPRPSGSPTCWPASSDRPVRSHGRAVTPRRDRRRRRLAAALGYAVSCRDRRSGRARTPTRPLERSRRAAGHRADRPSLVIGVGAITAVRAVTLALRRSIAAGSMPSDDLHGAGSACSPPGSAAHPEPLRVTRSAVDCAVPRVSPSDRSPSRATVERPLRAGAAGVAVRTGSRSRRPWRSPA